MFSNPATSASSSPPTAAQEGLDHAPESQYYALILFMVFHCASQLINREKTPYFKVLLLVLPQKLEHSISFTPPSNHSGSPALVETLSLKDCKNGTGSIVCHRTAVIGQGALKVMMTPVWIRESATSWLSLSMHCNSYSTQHFQDALNILHSVLFCHMTENEVVLRFSINSSCCGWDLKVFQLWADIFTVLFPLIISFSAFLNIILRLQVIFTRSSNTNSNLINILKENLF